MTTPVVADSITISQSTQSPAPIPHLPRNFLSFPGSSYVLPHDTEEGKRLQLQHDIIKTAFSGETLLPPVKRDSTGTYFVLDSGVGTGAWVFDIAPQLSPSSILHGIDIETRLFPQSRPFNFSLSINSVTALPRDWEDKFDIVHQRLLLTALKAAEWPCAIAELYRVLAPGGWIQLGEVGEWYAGPKTAHHRRLMRAVFESRELLLDVSKQIPEFLSDAGFVEIHEEKRTMPLGSWQGTYGTDVRNNYSGAFRATKTPTLNAGGFGYVKTEEEFDRLLDEVVQEWDDTEDAGVIFHIFYARKPIIQSSIKST